MEVEWIWQLGGGVGGTGWSGGKGECDQGVTYVKNKNIKKNNIGFKKRVAIALNQ